MPAIRKDSAILRLIKDVNEIRSALRRVTVNIPLYDIANENTPTQLTTDQNNYVIGNYDVLRMSSSKTVTITGLRGGVKGRSLRIYNVGNNTILLSHQDASSNAANRFRFPQGRTGYIGPDTNLQVYYDSTEERWISVVEDFDFPPTFTYVNDLSQQPRDVVYSDELGIFCLVAQGGQILTSSDGISWTLQVAPIVVYAGVSWSPDLNLFVAVGNNAVSSSPDGVTWTSRTPAAANNWQRVTWSPELGLFAAVSITGVGNRVMTSPDGINWTSRVSAADEAWRDIAWSPDLGLFAAVSTAGVDNVMTSPDGITWTLRTNPSGANGVDWSPELGVFATSTRYSSDGITWTAAKITAVTGEVKWNSISKRFLSISASGGTMAHSIDGSVWTPLPNTYTATALCFSVAKNFWLASNLNGQIAIFK